MKEEYRTKLRLRLASAAISPSTIRRMAPAGTIGPARSFLEGINLERFSQCKPEQFQKILDDITKEYQLAVPNLPWGAARKILNIFLRDCLYNRWVCEDYDFTRVESLLEVPLDRAVVEELKHRDQFGILPAWNGVIRLEEDESKKFQAFANEIAAANQVLRVDLDIEYWRGEKAMMRKNGGKADNGLLQS